MKNTCSYFIMIFIFAFSSFSKAADASVDVKLSPAGSFTGKTSDVKGFAKKQGTKFVAENIVVNLKSLKTGMGLRDKHTQDHLKTSEFPEAILVKAEGEKGAGKGVIKIKGIEKPISGKFAVKGKILTAIFPLKLSDFQIDGIKYMGVGVKDDVIVKVNVPVK